MVHLSLRIGKLEYDQALSRRTAEAGCGDVSIAVRKYQERLPDPGAFRYARLRFHVQKYQDPFQL